MQTFFDILPTSDFGVVAFSMGIIAVVLAPCAYLLWDDLFRTKKKTK